MQIENGITAIIQTYNFINDNLIKSDTKVKRDKDIISFSQDGNWIMMPEFLHEVMIIPSKFKSGIIYKSDLIDLYDSLAFIVDKKGRVQDQYMESYITPEVFGFSIYSRYPKRSEPGIRKIITFKFKVRNKLGFIL